MSYEHLPQIIQLRHQLHQYPELPFQEKKSADTIIEYLSGYHPDKIVRHLGGYGLAAVYEGGRSGPTILLRADLDALPIEETNKLDYKSKNKGISHACGHDGHAAILAGLAPLLAAKKPERGRVVLLFQPAEENVKGAKSVIADQRFKEIWPDYAFALHNEPGFPLNRIMVRDKTMMAAVKTVIIRLYGKTAHASRPENGKCPFQALNTIVRRIESKQNTDKNSHEFTLATVVGFSVGESPSYGVLPADGKLFVTLRTFTDEMMDRTTQKIEKIIQEIAAAENLRIDEIAYDEACPATVNSTACNEIIREAAAACGLTAREMAYPSPGAEDFSEFIRVSKSGGAMFFVGSGADRPALHNPDYDFPDEIIETGLKMFRSIIERTTG